MSEINPKIFKAYDIRGKYPEEINERAVAEISAALARHFGEGAKIIIGHDARLSSPALYEAVLKSLEIGPPAGGWKLEIKPAGLMTTPMLYFLVNELKADGGIMVTASHNPKEYNGLKAVGKNARPISGTEIYTILRKYENVRNYEKMGGKISYIRNISYFRKYANFLRRFIKIKRPIKVVFDCSNGTTGTILKELFRKSDVKGQMSKVAVVFINDTPDGNFSAHGPNPMAKGAMKQLEREVKKQKADLGVIFDADGDRVFFVDNRGRQIDPNEIGYILAQESGPPYVVGVTSSWRLKKLKGAFVSRVGHYFFKQLMREKKATLGAEHSGHYYFPFTFGKNTAHFDSGILGAIKVINFVSALDADAASWLDALPKYYRSGELNFEISDKKAAMKKIENHFRPKAKKFSKLDGFTMEFDSPAGEWWFNLRPSNTENFIRLNLEATSKKILKNELQNLKNLLIS